MTASTHRSHHESAGFTVVEMLVALAIMVVVTVPILMVLQSATNAEVTHTNKIEAATTGSIAVERISTDLRSAGKFDLQTSDRIVMATLDAAGDWQEVSWERDGDQLIRTVFTGARTEKSLVLSDLATTPAADMFTAFDSSGNEILTSGVACPGYISVDIERVVDDKVEHLLFDVASRNLNAGTGTC